MRITVYERLTAVAPIQEPDLTWSELAAWLSEPEIRLDKDGPLWSPTELAPGKGRANDSVIWVTAAVFDLDNVDEPGLAALLQRLSGHELIVHTTHSHTPERMKLRLVLRLSKPVRAFDWRGVYSALVRKFEIPTDPACKDASRAYFLPSHAPGGEFLFDSVPGTPVDVAALRVGERAVQPVRVSSVDRPFEPDPDDVVTHDAGEIRKRIQTSIRGKENTPLRAILDGAPVASQGSRDTTLNQAMSSLAWRVAPGTPWEALLPVVRDSITKMEHLPGEDWMGTAQRQYERAQERSHEFHTAERKRRDAVAALVKTRTARPSLIEVEVTWNVEDRLITRWTKDGNVPEHCLQNAITIFQDHPECQGTIRFNTLKKQIECTGGPLAEATPNTLSTWAAAYLHTQHGIKLATHVVREALLAVAEANRYNPVAEWLVSLEWDGKERLDTMLETHFGASVEDESGEDISDHVRRISSKFMLSAVARGIEPGCQVDTTLILEGPQGSGKTEAFRALGGEWYVSSDSTAGDKDARMAATNGWVCELAELASFRKADSQAIKAFLDKRIDHYRPPYGAAIEAHARGCVFVGTTNDQGYLTDHTGNRRYWPIACPGEIDLDAIKRDRDQLFAEAMTRYRAGERWHLVGHEQKTAADVASARVGEDEVDIYKQAIDAWWSRLPVERRKALTERKELTTSFIAEKCLGLSIKDVSRAVVTRAGQTLLALGWEKRRSGSAPRHYVPPEAWIDRPVVSITFPGSEKKP